MRFASKLFVLLNVPISASSVAPSFNTLPLSVKLVFLFIKVSDFPYQFLTRFTEIACANIFVILLILKCNALFKMTTSPVTQL